MTGLRGLHAGDHLSLPDTITDLDEELLEATASLSRDVIRHLGLELCGELLHES